MRSSIPSKAARSQPTSSSAQPSVPSRVPRSPALASTAARVTAPTVRSSRCITRNELSKAAASATAASAAASSSTWLRWACRPAKLAAATSTPIVEPLAVRIGLARTRKAAAPAWTSLSWERSGGAASHPATAGREASTSPPALAPARPPQPRLCPPARDPAPGAARADLAPAGHRSAANGVDGLVVAGGGPAFSCSASRESLPMGAGRLNTGRSGVSPRPPAGRYLLPCRSLPRPATRGRATSCAGGRHRDRPREPGRRRRHADPDGDRRCGRHDQHSQNTPRGAHAPTFLPHRRAGTTRASSRRPPLAARWPRAPASSTGVAGAGRDITARKRP